MNSLQRDRQGNYRFTEDICFVALIIKIEVWGIL